MSELFVPAVIAYVVLVVAVKVKQKREGFSL